MPADLLQKRRLVIVLCSIFAILLASTVPHALAVDANYIQWSSTDTMPKDPIDIQLDIQRLPTANTPNESTVILTDNAASALPWNKQVNAKAAMVMDTHSGQVLYAKNENQIRAIASITKLMTAIVILDAKLDMHATITLTEEDINGPKLGQEFRKSSSTQLREGDQLNRAELLLIALMKSENPAAAALARTYPGGYAQFLDKMNQKAHALGMSSAFFGDPTGLDTRNVASTRDLIKMVHAASSYSLIRNFSSTQSYDFNLGGRILHAKNTNAIVRSGGWNINLSKTGFINESGRCLVLIANTGKREAVIVVMGASSSQQRTLDAEHILNWLQTL